MSLDDVMKLPAGRGYLEAGATWGAEQKLAAYADAAWHVRDNVALFAQGQYAGRDDYGAQAGLRINW